MRPITRSEFAALTAAARPYRNKMGAFVAGL